MCKHKWHIVHRSATAGDEYYFEVNISQCRECLRVKNDIKFKRGNLRLYRKIRLKLRRR